MGSVLVIGAVSLVAAMCSRGAAPTGPSSAAPTPGVASATVEGQEGHVHAMSQDDKGMVGHVHADSVSEESPAVASELAAVRAATAKYHDVAAAVAAGYQLGFRGVVTGCIANPTAGAMGYHYFNWAKMDDPSIISVDPEVLVYHTADDGALVLGAVEWVVPKPLWEQAGNSQPPVVFGQPLHVLNPVLNWYIEHAWIWTHNPAGIFADWNPEVSCP
jgi:hypothetical protein